MSLRRGAGLVLFTGGVLSVAVIVSCESQQDLQWGGAEAQMDSRKLPVPETRSKAIGMMYNFPPPDGSSPEQPPGYFVRASGSIAAAWEELKIPEGHDTILYEGELVVVVGKRARSVTPEEASACILGYTCGMDGSPLILDAKGERDAARSLAGKSFDRIAPVGPWVVTGIDPKSQEIQLRVNGQVVERCHTRDLIWGPARVVSEISRTTTLEPGDLIFMGASRAVEKFTPGDVVEVEITDIGTLRNTIAGERPPADG